MLSKENNQLICSVGPGTPTGALFRSVWLPALLSSERPGSVGIAQAQFPLKEKTSMARARFPGCRALLRTAFALIFLSSSLLVHAQSALSWPAANQNVRVIVPFPGGASLLDSVVRVITPEVAKYLGTAVVVDNKPGAGTVIGVDADRKSVV